MQIASIKISNFKGLHDVEFSPSTFGCVVGENNAGKSSILQALVYALNRPTQLDRSLYYDETSPVEFKLTVTGVTDAHLRRLDESHRDRIASIINNGNFILIVRYRIGEKIELKVESLTPNEGRYTFDNLTENFKGKRGAAVRSVIEETYPEFLPDAPAGISATQAKEYLLQRIGALPPEAFSLQEGQLPTGISSSITSLLPEPIYIPAVKNINDELKTSQSASFGRLLGLLLEDMTPDLANITEVAPLFSTAQQHL